MLEESQRPGEYFILGQGGGLKPFKGTWQGPIAERTQAELVGLRVRPARQPASSWPRHRVELHGRHSMDRFDDALFHAEP
jgi:hypothetical protein